MFQSGGPHPSACYSGLVLSWVVMQWTGLPKKRHLLVQSQHPIKWHQYSWLSATFAWQENGSRSDMGNNVHHIVQRAQGEPSSVRRKNIASGFLAILALSAKMRQKAVLKACASSENCLSLTAANYQATSARAIQILKCCCIEVR